MFCPVCGDKIYTVSFGDHRCWYRCLKCDVVLEINVYKKIEEELET